MNIFLKRSILFILLGIFILHLKAFFMLYDNRYTKKAIGREIYRALEKSNSIHPSKSVLIGDSVGLQLFDSNEENDTLNSLATNQAISLAGQYILLHNYIKVGNKIDKAYLVFTPFSFVNNLNQVYTYNYFIKPFYNKKNAPLLNETVKQQVEKIPFSFLANYPLILTSNWTPDYQCDEVNTFGFLSPISAQYLRKISQLAKDNHFKIIIVSPPISSKRKKDVESINKNEIINNHLQEEFKSYFDHIIYIDESKFSDGIHLKEPEKYKNFLHTIFN